MKKGRNHNFMNIRAIQHYMYCPRRFGLLECNKDWNENAFVVHAELIHKHVHDGSHQFSDDQKVVRSSIDVYNDLPAYDLYGILDCVEFIRNKNGVPINGLDGTYKVRIVEYKPKAPKDAAFHETDAIQVFAQKICADFVWKCNSEAFLYYANTRKRIALPFDESYEFYDTMLKQYLNEMRAIIESHLIPPRKKGQKCSGCSLSDICFAKEKKYNVKDIVMSMKGANLS